MSDGRLAELSVGYDSLILSPYCRGDVRMATPGVSLIGVALWITWEGCMM